MSVNFTRRHGRQLCMQQNDLNTIKKVQKFPANKNNPPFQNLFERQMWAYTWRKFPSFRLCQLKWQNQDNTTLRKEHTKTSHLNILWFVEDDSFIFNLEPLHSIVLGNPVLNANTGLSSLSPADSVSRTF